MNELIIKKADLLHNIKEIKKMERKKDYTYIAVVKGNAYGLGMVEFTKFLIGNGFHYFAVATMEEALTLRENNIRENILLLTPYSDVQAVERLIKEDITLTIDSKVCFEIVNNAAKRLDKQVRVHIKVDTGLSRYGFHYQDTDTMKSIVKGKSNIIFEGIYSHFSNSLAQNSLFSELQFSRFVRVIEELQQNDISFSLQHICNSSGFFKYPHMHLNAARIGSAFIGYGVGINSNLKRIGLFHTKIMRIKEIKKGEYIGYGNSYKARKDIKIAILPTGYYDGVGLTIDVYRFQFLRKAKQVMLDVKDLFDHHPIYLDQFSIIGQIGMHDIVIDITGKDYKENDDIYFTIKPVTIESSIKRVYK